MLDEVKDFFEETRRQSCSNFETNQSSPVGKQPELLLFADEAEWFFVTILVFAIVLSVVLASALLLLSTHP